MNPLEIILIIIGIIVIIISCRLVDKSTSVNRPALSPAELTAHLTEEDKKQLMDKMNELLSEVSEETIVHADDTLSKLSNEKIMAVNEFSEQILEKINRNHEEVVFLYSMLNDKEEELKATVKEIDSSKKKVQEIMESKTAIEKLTPAKTAKTQTAPRPAPPTQADGMEKNIARSTQLQSDRTVPTLGSVSSGNNNAQILALYSQGKSIMEISKLLGLGQGEVKLVIDLFKGKK